jgi:hypothetical protein
MLTRVVILKIPTSKSSQPAPNAEPSLRYSTEFGEGVNANVWASQMQKGTEFGGGSNDFSHTKFATVQNHFGTQMNAENADF